MATMKIPFNKPTSVGNEEKYLFEVLHSGKWSGRGPKTMALEALAKSVCGSSYAFFVTSGSSALEVGCLLADLKPGDEVIMPSFDFVSAANAVAARGAKPVFADINRETWNIDVSTVEPLLTAKTRAIMPVHYNGSSAGINEFRSLCERRNLFLIEDAAQSFGAKRDGKPVGSSPWVTCFSFHDTKNVVCGEGGMIMTDDRGLAERIEIIIEKGTDRQRFFRGQVDKYTWVSLGASFVASDFLAAIALAQLEKIETITIRRKEIFEEMKSALAEFESKILWQKVPEGVETNGHVAGFVMEPKLRQEFLELLKKIENFLVNHSMQLLAPV